jgi:hypothetical protein
MYLPFLLNAMHLFLHDAPGQMLLALQQAP